MKKTIYIILLHFIIIASIHAQATIGSENTPDEGAILEITSGNNKGMLLPRVYLSNPASWAPLQGTPKDGMIVFNTNTLNKDNLKGKGTYLWYNNEWHIIQRGSAPCSNVPDTPSAITFNTRTIDRGKNELFIVASVPEVINAGTYTWSLPAGLSGTSNENYITITASEAKPYDATQIKVIVSNDCGSSAQVSGTGEIIVK